MVKKVYKIIKLLENNGMKAWDKDSYHYISADINISHKRNLFNSLDVLMIIGKRYSILQRIMDSIKIGSKLRDVIGILDLKIHHLLLYGGIKIYQQYEKDIKKFK